MAAYYPEIEKTRLLFLRAKILSKRGIGPGGVESAFKQALLDSQKRKEEQKVDFFAKYATKKGVSTLLADKFPLQGATETILDFTIPPITFHLA